MKKAVLTVAIATLVSSAMADDSVMAGTLGIGNFEGDPSIFATFTRLEDDSNEMVIEASKNNIDINLYKPIKTFKDVVSVGFESGYIKFKDYDPAGSVGVGLATTHFIDAPYLQQKIGIYLKTGLDLTFGSARKYKEVVTNTYDTIEKEVRLNSIGRITLAVGYDRFVVGVSYKRINLLNPNGDDRVNFFVGYSFTW